MMNALALGLVLTSLLTAGFFTPNPDQNQNKLKEDVIVKEGHRVVVVEYEKDDVGNTKVSISPQDSQLPHKVDEKVSSFAKDKLSEKIDDIKEGVKEASSSVLPDVGQVGNQEKEQETHHRFSPKELVCDAYGKCKHKIASALGKTKEAVAEKAHEAADKVYAVEEEAKEAVSEAIGKVKDTVSETAHKAYDKVYEAKESAKDSASKVEKEASEKMEGTKEMVKEKAKEVKKEGQKELGEIMHRAREVAVDAFDYVISKERLASLTGVLHLMGFAAAYGMCVWITFASSYVLAGALPRNQFAMVQSKMYPVYFKAMAYSVGITILGHLMGQRKRLLSPTLQGFNLTASLAMILVNLLVLEPRATKVMLERMKKEKEEGREKEGHATEPSARVVDSTAETAGRVSATAATTQGAAQEKPELLGLSETLQRLNSYSSFLNVLTLMSLTWHLVHLGQRLHAVC